MSSNITVNFSKYTKEEFIEEINHGDFKHLCPSSIGLKNIVDCDSEEECRICWLNAIQDIQFKDETTVTKDDEVNHPKHYTKGKYESIDKIEDSLIKEGIEGYLTGTILKYLFRYKHKGNPTQDLEKASWYLNRLINFEKESK